MICFSKFSERKKTLFHLLCITLLGAIAYSNTFHAPFILDDVDLIVENPALENLSSFFESTNWSSPSVKGRWIPLVSFAFNRSIGGLNVAGFHIVNLLIHLTTGMLVYFLAAATLKSFGSDLQKRYSSAPLPAALFFVLHPVQTQAVTYIVQRMASLATLFYLAAFLLYANAFIFRPAQANASLTRRTVLYLGALVACLLSMETKEISFTLPLMLLVFDFSFLEGSFRQRLIRLSPFLVCMALMPLYLFGPDGVPHADGNPNTAALPHLTYILTEFRVLVTYLRLLVLPIAQNLDYDYPLQSAFFQPHVTGSLILLMTLFTCGILLVKQSRNRLSRLPVLTRIAGFAILWFFVTLSVESGMVPLQDVIFEHRLYLPSVWFCIALGFASAELRQGSGIRQIFATVATLAVLILLGSATYLRNRVWSDERALWQDVTRKSPGKARGWSALGRYHVNRLDPVTAIPLLEHALKINPEFYPALYNLGLAAVQAGDPERAIKLYTRATEIAPECDKGWELGGRLLLDIGRNTEAAYFLSHSRKLDPARMLPVNK